MIFKSLSITVVNTATLRDDKDFRWKHDLPLVIGETYKDAARSETISVNLSIAGGINSDIKEAYGVASFPGNDGKNTSKTTSRALVNKGLGSNPPRLKPSENKDVYIKWATDKSQRDILSYEALFYAYHLYDLQGGLVSRFLGFYEGRIEGKWIAFSIFEGDKISLEHDNIDADDLIEAVDTLHEEGIIHTGLLDRSGDKPKLSKNIGISEQTGRIRFTDFTLAKAYVRQNELSFLRLKMEYKGDKEESKDIEAYLKERKLQASKLLT